MVKYKAVKFKKDQIAALYFTMFDIVHHCYPRRESELSQILDDYYLFQFPINRSEMPDKSAKFVSPVKAFWQPRKSNVIFCNACTPYIAIDPIFAELTCIICGHQAYKEKCIKKHIHVSSSFFSNFKVDLSHLKYFIISRKSMKNQLILVANQKNLTKIRLKIFKSPTVMILNQA